MSSSVNPGRSPDEPDDRSREARGDAPGYRRDPSTGPEGRLSRRAVIAPR